MMQFISQWFLRRQRRKRAATYLGHFPDDMPAVQAVLMALDLSPQASARDAAEMLMGSAISNEAWQKISARWERAWAALAT